MTTVQLNKENANISKNRNIAYNDISQFKNNLEKLKIISEEANESIYDLNILLNQSKIIDYKIIKNINDTINGLKNAHNRLNEIIREYSIKPISLKGYIDELTDILKKIQKGNNLTALILESIMVHSKDDNFDNSAINDRLKELI